jgi:predicted nucleotidyltransferase
MRTSAPLLLPIFRSELQGRLLALLYAQPDVGQSITALAGKLGSHVATVQREVARLEEAGILASERIGQTRIVRPNLTSPYADDLSSLVIKAFGPAHVLGALLSGVAGVERAYLFGSWASRYRGLGGPAPADIDVLVVGKPDRDAVDRLGLVAQEQLGREVNISIRSLETWERSDDGFLQSVRAGDLVPIDLDAR